MHSITTALAPEARGHYAQAIVHGGIVYVSGQLPVVADRPEARPAGFDEEARQVLRNVLAIVEAAGSRRDRILRATVYLVGVENWPAFNRIYAEVLGSHRPARTVVPVPALHHGFLVEMDAIAAVGEN